MIVKLLEASKLPSCGIAPSVAQPALFDWTRKNRRSGTDTRFDDPILRQSFPLRVCRLGPA